MGMTMAEKVLARASGQKRVKAGQYVTASVDRMMAHEAFASCFITLKRLGVNKLYDPDRVVIILDHYFPAPTVRMAQGHKLIRQAVEEFGIKNFLGHAGICHQAMVEGGHVLPGRLILATDSHTTTYGALGAASAGIGVTEMSYVLATGELWMQVPPTIRFDLTGKPVPGIMSKDIVLYIAGEFSTEIAQYRAIEFTGEVAKRMSLASRMTLSNMGVELGAKFAFFEADEKTIDYLKERTTETPSRFGPDPDAEYETEHSVDITALEPQVAVPHNPGNVKPVSEIGDQPVDQAFLGSCTNGRLEDLAVAAQILKGRRVNPGTRLLVTPASQKVMLDATRAGYVETFLEAGAHITPAGCGPCPGGHMGLLASDEVCISSTNRNFRGRMGSPESQLFLGSPATVAASAITGRITDPRQFWSETTLS
ncbi:MAG: 3-isopropylmalate dehydratase large subunit [Deltaproteobacteria bacterium]|nr:3-isopropylmalate dehydratase large subunit [Deltaproteobacteria bacterium]MBW2050931.1 3-isopropylmalate dehydratase large subunit [Deltaproteobacteria bacterium]MBW2141186.1 3-isopropylmalate dehydratase large subunit [Deltaproteobacteria bacterium]MBW2323696.1 3-isopropylmalate dehydratase large subunit [Deltaproteobacteria bacterium]